MSELKNVRRSNHRWELLTTVSALSLFIVFCGVDEALAESADTDQPMVWVELGGQLQRMSGTDAGFQPSFINSVTQANLLSALNVQQPSLYSIGMEGKVSFQPTDSDWVFSASVQYGRSSTYKHLHQQTPNATIPVHFHLLPPYSNKYVGPKYYYPTLHVKFSDGVARQSETHGVIDFQAGKDVGLGLFGRQGASVLTAGVRIAQFTSKSSVTMHAEPDVQYPTAAITSKYEFNAFKNAHIRFHDFAASAYSQRSFRGVGPSLAWNASRPFVGDAASGEVSLDWGVNGAVLFGRQKAVGHHKSIAKSYYMTTWHEGFSHGKLTPGHFQNNQMPSAQLYTGGATAHHTNAADFSRARTVVVPNLGGFAGASYRVEDFKVALGYRADFSLVP